MKARIMGRSTIGNRGGVRRVVILGIQKSFVLEAATLEHDHIPDAAGSVRMELKLGEMQDIARSEMARRRRQLGNLTPDQELALETLLISTVSRISEIVVALEL